MVLRPIILLFLLFPCVLIGIAWRKLAAQAAGRVPTARLELATLVLIGLSQVLLMSGLLSTAVIGDDYSSRRYVTIAINAAAMLAATIVAAVAARRARFSLAFAAAWVTVSWVYVGLVSSAV